MEMVVVQNVEVGILNTKLASEKNGDQVSCHCPEVLNSISFVSLRAFNEAKFIILSLKPQNRKESPTEEEDFFFFCSEKRKTSNTW